MATLKSINNQDSLTIEPLYFQSKEEGWISSKLELSHKGEKAVEATEPYFEIAEAGELIADIKKLLINKVSKIESNFLEPNLELGIEHVKHDVYMVYVLCRFYINFEDGEIRDTEESTRSLRFDTDRNQINKFVGEFELELQNLQSHNQ